MPNFFKKIEMKNIICLNNLKATSELKNSDPFGFLRTNAEFFLKK